MDEPVWTTTATALNLVHWTFLIVAFSMLLTNRRARFPDPAERFANARAAGWLILAGGFCAVVSGILT